MRAPRLPVRGPAQLAERRGQWRGARRRSLQQQQQQQQQQLVGVAGGLGGRARRAGRRRGRWRGLGWGRGPGGRRRRGGVGAAGSRLPVHSSCPGSAVAVAAGAARALMGGRAEAAWAGPRALPAPPTHPRRRPGRGPAGWGCRRPRRAPPPPSTHPATARPDTAIGFRATFIWDDLISIFHLIASAKTLFPKKVPFPGSRDQVLDMSSWGEQFNPLQPPSSQEKTERLMPSRMGRTGNVPTVIGRANLSHDVITNRERPPGSFDIVHLKDANGNSFAMKIYNILVSGKGNQAWISLPRRKGIPG
ncbi:uncharacterized protein [Equus asinus]|uniref:uncharacterized protein n=1 Tax=Equus asinus TaxID=9793 RepID=UPI0038F6FC33